jgi:hypothetical protein
MPFINQARREAVDNGNLDVYEPGDLCYLYYKYMVVKWKREPRWTTAHNIYEEMVERLGGVSWDVNNPELEPAIRATTLQRKAAYQLAWQVFFQIYVMPYELKKREENGDI